MEYLGDFLEDSSLQIHFTTQNRSGGAVAPSSPFEAADVRIYKDGSATEKTTTNGLTMTSPFDSLTGLHLLEIDTSNDTGDAGFWQAGHDYTVVLSPDETVDGQTVIAVLQRFSLENRNTQADVVDKTGFSLSAAGIQAIWDALTSVLTTAGSIGKLIVDNLNATISSRLASAAYTAPDNASITAIKAKTDNLPADPADASDIAALVDALPTAIENADALLDRANGVETSYTLRQAMRLVLSALAGKLNGAATTTLNIRDVNDTKDRIVATVDADGNRTAVTKDVS